MQTEAHSASSILFGSDTMLGVERGIAEFRCGRPVLMLHGDRAELVLPAEGIDDDRLLAFQEMCAPAIPELAITASRALALGLKATEAVLVGAGSSITAAAVAALGSGRAQAETPAYRTAGVAALAGIDLAKLAQKLPAVLVASVDVSAVRKQIGSVVSVDAKSVSQFHQHAVETLQISAEANVPLEGRYSARFVIFTNAIGDNSVAVIVGTPDTSKPVAVRLHSACLTGDVFGSRRCDCGDQLRLALARIEELGSGVILYMAQEGRGLGLANKMRAYQLQDEGLDTVDANTTLGFDEDERSYGIAARMLDMLGCKRITLLTNNPAKVDALRDTGIEVVSRVPLVTPINVHNRRYLNAKALRAGHDLGQAANDLSPAEMAEDVAFEVKLAP